MQDNECASPCANFTLVMKSLMEISYVTMFLSPRDSRFNHHGSILYSNTRSMRFAVLCTMVRLLSSVARSKLWRICHESGDKWIIGDLFLAGDNDHRNIKKAQDGSQIKMIVRLVERCSDKAFAESVFTAKYHF